MSTKLIIKQSQNTAEQVATSLIDKLYQLASTEGILTNDSDLEGTISTGTTYEDAVTFLQTRFPNLTILANAYYIRFVDSNVLQILLNANIGDGVGISTANAAIANIGTIFRGNSTITDFDEFKYFTIANTTGTYFNGCTNLESIDLSYCTKLNSDYFDGCQNLSYFHGRNSEEGVLTVAEGTSVIGGFCFRKCKGLTTIILPDSVTELSYRPFTDCTSLTKIYFGSGISTIGENVFGLSGASSLVEVHVKDLDTWVNVSFGMNPLQYAHHLYCNNQEVTSYSYQSGTTSIGNNSWRGCLGLTSVTIPTSVSTIGSRAFGGCNNLVITDLNLPNLTSLGDYCFEHTKVQTISDLGNVTTIPSYCFNACPFLTNVSIPNSVTSIGYYAFNSCSGLVSITIPNNVTSIGENAFRDCSNLASITIGSGVTTIGYNAFYGCSQLVNVYLIDLAAWCGISFSGNPLDSNNKWKHLYLNGAEIINLTIPNSVTSIGYGAFMRCGYITSVVIPNTVTTIGTYAFEYDFSLTSVTIGTGVTEISSMAFYQCTALTSITITATTPPTISTGTFLDTNNCPIYVPAGSVSAYQTTGDWTTYASRIQAIPT